MSVKAQRKKKTILESAKAIVLENDFQSLTLEGVAKRAGISKGGLLYHFPNKNQLIKELTVYIFDQFQQDFTETGEQDPVQEGRWTRALIKACTKDVNENAELNIGVVALSMLDGSVVENISRSYQTMIDQLEKDELDPVTVAIIRLSLDGIYYAKMLNIAPIDEQLHDDVVQRLLKMTKVEE